MAEKAMRDSGGPARNVRFLDGYEIIA